MSEGWFKAFRKVKDSRVFANEGLFKVFWWCLCRANYKDECWESAQTGRGKVSVKVSRGQFVFGRSAAAKELNMSPSTVWKRLCRLASPEFQCVTIESNSNWSIVTVVNWEQYQGGGGDGEPDHHDHQAEAPPPKKRRTKALKTEKLFDAGYSPDFLEFWAVYPRRVAQPAAWKAWKALKGDRPPVDVLIAAVRKQMEKYPSWQRGGGEYIPYPASWLNGQRWLDEDPDLDKDSTSTEYKEGYAAAKRGDRVCPYAKGTTAREQWGRGYSWYQEQQKWGSS